MGNDIKVDIFLAREELPAFFRELADTLENGGGTGNFTCVDQFARLKISLRDDFGQLSLKMRTTPAEVCLPPKEGGQSAKPKYKRLKKRMKSSFKLIFKMLHEDQAPPQAAVDSFVADSRLMCTYPGYGDEYYAEYLAATDEFEAAFAAGAVEPMRAAAVKLANLKGRCHAKYD